MFRKLFSIFWETDISDFCCFRPSRLGFREVSSDNVYDGELTKLWRRQFANFFFFCIIYAFFRSTLMSASTCFRVSRLLCIRQSKRFCLRNKSRWEPFMLVHRQSSQPWWSSLLFRTQCLDLWRLPAFVRRSAARRIFLSSPTNEAVSLASLIFPSKCGDEEGQPVRQLIFLVDVFVLLRRIWKRKRLEFYRYGYRVQSSLQYSRLPP